MFCTHGPQFHTFNIEGSLQLSDAMLTLLTSELSIERCMGAELTSAALAYLPNPHRLRDLRIGNYAFFDEHTLAAVAHGTLLRLALHELPRLTDVIFRGNFSALQQLELADFDWSAYETLTLAPLERMQNLLYVSIHMHDRGYFNFSTPEGVRAWSRMNFGSFMRAWEARFDKLRSYHEDPLFPWPHICCLRTDFCDLGPEAPTDSDEDIGRHSSQCESDTSSFSAEGVRGARGAIVAAPSVRVFHAYFACSTFLAYWHHTASIYWQYAVILGTHTVDAQKIKIL